jgi:dTDP-4-dehydrorhamnose reductase
MSGVEFLVFGASGYFGSELVRYLEKGGHSFAVTKARIESRDQIEAAIAQHQPKYVLNAAGLAGTPNIVRTIYCVPFFLL